MNRWIDADALIERWNKMSVRGRTEFDQEIMLAPSIDIVRCKECKWRNENCGMGEHKWCEKLNMSTTPNDFCSYAERRE